MSEEKKVSQARSWIITDFNVAQNPEELAEKLRGKGWSGVFQLESGSETNHEHYQMYVEHKTNIRFTTLQKLFPGAHLEPRRGSKRQAWDYCSKEDTRVSGPWIIAEIDLGSEQGKRSDLEFFHEFLIQGGDLGDLLIQYPQAIKYTSGLSRLAFEISIKKGVNQYVNRNVIFISGPTGTGKTRHVFDSYKPEEFYRVTNWRNPFDGYRGQRVVVFDEFMAQLPLSTMLMILDNYSSVLPARYSDVVNLSEEVVIISNLSFGEIRSRYELNGASEAQLAALERRIDEIWHKGALNEPFEKRLRILP